MPLQFTCPFCKASQMAPDDAPGQQFACVRCGRVIKIAPAPAPVPLARPVTGPSVRRRPRANLAMHVVVVVVALTMVAGVSLAIFFRPGQERPAPQPTPQAKLEPGKGSREEAKSTSPKKVTTSPEPEPDADLEAPPSLLARTMGEWYLDGAELKVRMDFKALDPMATIKDLKVIVWTGEFGAPKIASWRSPRIRPGDSTRQEVAVPFKDGRGSAEVPLPVLAKDKAYWLQPMLVDGDGKSQWLAVEPWEPATPPLERRPALIQHKLESGKRNAQVSSQATVTVTGAREKEYEFIIDIRADLKEHVKVDGAAGSIFVKYSRVQFEFSQNGVPALVERVLGDALDDASKIANNWRLDTAGAISKRTVNMDDVPEDVRKDLAIVDERLAKALELASLPLPNRELKALENWNHRRTWAGGMLDLTATYEGRRNHQKRDEAYLSLRGKFKAAGKTGEGAVEGMALVDLRDGYLIKAELKIEMDIAVPFISREEVRGPGVLEVRLTREELR